MKLLKKLTYYIIVTILFVPIFSITIILYLLNQAIDFLYDLLIYDSYLGCIGKIKKFLTKIL